MIHGLKRRFQEWFRPPEPLPVASGMLVLPPRAATVCEVDRARKRAASRKRAQNLGYRTNRWGLITRNDPLDSHLLM